MTINPYKEGRCLVWDFICLDTFAGSHLSNTSREAGKAAETGERTKIAKYSCLPNDCSFVPVAIETAGPWGESGLKLIRELGAKISEITGENRSTAFLMQSISVAIQRGNAISILGTSNDHEKLDEIFYL